METLSLILTAIILILLILIFFIYKIGIKQGKTQKELQWQQQLISMKADIANNQRANIKGKVAETFAPFLPNFPFKPSECKFLGDPIDYIVFDGLDNREIKGIHFLEIKSDKAKLSKHQKQIKDLVDSLDTNKVTFNEFNFQSNRNTNEYEESDTEMKEI